MKKIKNEICETTNSTVYRRKRITIVTGCCLNCKKRQRKNHNNWKVHRKYKWKEPKII